MTKTCSEEAIRVAMKRLVDGTTGEGSEQDEGEATPNKDRRRAVKEALEEIAESDAHLEAICSALLRACRFFPTVAEVWSIGEATDAPKPVAPARTNCPECGGSGWVRTQVVGGGKFASMRYSAVRNCACRSIG